MEILKNIPILTYHKISDAKEFGLTTVSPCNFYRQLTILKELEFNPITFKDLEKGVKPPKNPIIITFDDGYESVYDHALPIMEKIGFRGVVYIITDFIGEYNTWEAVSFQQKYRHLSMPQIKELQIKGFEIASHGKSHRFYPFMKNDQIQYDLKASKKFLEDQTGEKIISFCYPYGRSTRRIVDIVQEAGYKYAAQNISFLNKRNNNRLALNRRSIYSTDKINLFISKVKKPFGVSVASLSEMIIQKGVLASITINQLQNKK